MSHYISQSAQNPDTLIEAIRNFVIGDNIALDGLFGPRPIIYSDYAAPGPLGPWGSSRTSSSSG